MVAAVHLGFEAGPQTVQLSADGHFNLHFVDRFCRRSKTRREWDLNRWDESRDNQPVISYSPSTGNRCTKACDEYGMLMPVSSYSHFTSRPVSKSMYHGW